MYEFQVRDMTCGHCSSAVTAAVKSVDPTAEVKVDLKAHLVQVGSASIGPSEIAKVIENAGYTPTLSPNASSAAATSPPQRASGSCCGCCR
jgi:copper chaperone